MPAVLTVLIGAAVALLLARRRRQRAAEAPSRPAAPSPQPTPAPARAAAPTAAAPAPSARPAPRTTAGLAPAEPGDASGVSSSAPSSTSRAGSPDSPADLSSTSKKAVLKRTFREFQEDNLTDWAAALTYYGVLSLFPALIALVSILGLLGQSSAQTLIDNLGAVAPGPAKQIVTDVITNLQSNQSAAGVLFFVGLAGALWSASGYIAAFMRASNSIYDIEEGRPIWKTLPVRVGTTLVLVILLVLVALLVVLTGPILDQVGRLFGLGGTLLTVWSIAKWPVLLLIVAFMFAFLYWAAPNVKQPGFKWVSPGGLVGVVLLIVASALFAFYVGNFGSYDKTYGTLGGVISFLVWLWISNIAILLGAELNAELERGRRIASGQADEEQEPFVEPRDTRKMKHKG